MTDPPQTTLPVTGVPAARRWPDARRVGLFVALGLGLGALSGVVWWAVTDLPTFRVVEGGGAATTERGLAGYIAADAWFVVCGVVVGLVVGLVVLGQVPNLLAAAGILCVVAAGIGAERHGARVDPLGEPRVDVLTPG